MPDPKDYSNEKDFMHDSIKTNIQEGKPKDQAVAISINVWKNRNKKKKMSSILRSLAVKLSNSVQHSKSSLQYNLPKNIADDILTWSKNNIPKEELYTEEEGMGIEEEVHITVFYGILDEDEDGTVKVLKDYKIRPFSVTLSTITAFQNKPEYDVLKIDIESSELHKIHKLIDSHLDTKNDYPEYKPHLTLAYLKKGYVDKYIGNKFFKGIEVIAENLEFSSKSGSKISIDLKK
jgi:2'-5' RNA ligase